MLSVDYAFSERLYLCDLNSNSMQAREVVQSFNLTGLLVGCGAARIPRKFKAERKNIISLRHQNAQRHA